MFQSLSLVNSRPTVEYPEDGPVFTGAVQRGHSFAMRKTRRCPSTPPSSSTSSAGANRPPSSPRRPNRHGAIPVGLPFGGA